MVLKEKRFCGYKARDVYDKCCKEFGFDPTQSGKFAPQKHFFANVATPEGYSVWFLANSNWNGKTQGQWFNTIAGNLSSIEERCSMEIEPNQEHFVNNRVVFALGPGKLDGYKFVGVFKPESYNPDTHTRIYKRISAEYPIKSEEVEM